MAQKNFGHGTAPKATRQAIHSGHGILYARSPGNVRGTIQSKKDFLRLLSHGKTSAQRQHVKPAGYTHIVSADDDTFRFSETGAAFFVDFASKHALLASCATKVRYSGKFHPRPVGGWENYIDKTPDSPIEWELVIDNNSGTYSPDAEMSPALRRLPAHNFPGIKFIALEHKDPELERSRETCRAYAQMHHDIAKERRSSKLPLYGQYVKAGLKFGRRMLNGPAAALLSRYKTRIG